MYSRKYAFMYLHVHTIYVVYRMTQKLAIAAIFVYPCTNTYIFTFIYVYTHIHIQHIYIHTHVQNICCITRKWQSLPCYIYIYIHTHMCAYSWCYFSAHQNSEITDTKIVLSATDLVRGRCIAIPRGYVDIPQL